MKLSQGTNIESSFKNFASLWGVAQNAFLCTSQAVGDNHVWRLEEIVGQPRAGSKVHVNTCATSKQIQAHTAPCNGQFVGGRRLLNRIQLVSGSFGLETSRV